MTVATKKNTPVKAKVNLDGMVRERTIRNIEIGEDGLSYGNVVVSGVKTRVVRRRYQRTWTLA